MAVHKACFGALGSNIRLLNDLAARAGWGWKPAYDLASMTADMIRVLKQRQAAGKLN